MAKLPDLKYLEHLAWADAEHDFDRSRHTWIVHTSADLFLQQWPDASCGMKKDSASLAAQMITEEYTSVFELWWVYSDTDEEVLIYYVFFGNELAYRVKKPNEKFFEDLKNRYMAAVMDKDKYVG